MRPSPAERWLSAQDGRRLFYREYGDPLAPSLPLLCLPGLARNGQDYVSPATRLADKRRIVSPDYRGRGRSEHDPDWRNYAPSSDLNDLRHLFAVTGLHRAVVLGTSYGGLLAMGLGAVVPRATAGVILNDVGPDIPTGGQSRILGYIGEGRPQPGLAQAVAHLRELMPHLSISSDAEWESFARATYVEAPDGSLRVAWDPQIVKPLLAGAGAAHDLWALFGTLRRVPVLLIRGALSDVITADTAARMAALHPDLSEVIVPRSGHAPLLSEPECVQAIDDFLERVDSAHRR